MSELPADEANAKRRRYDRQLRLWGEHGQAAMEDSSICLINGSATGAETLKNLVLPGEGLRPPGAAPRCVADRATPVHVPR